MEIITIRIHAPERPGDNWRYQKETLVNGVRSVYRAKGKTFQEARAAGLEREAAVKARGKA